MIPVNAICTLIPKHKEPHISDNNCSLEKAPEQFFFSCKYAKTDQLFRINLGTETMHLRCKVYPQCPIHISTTSLKTSNKGYILN